MKLLEWIFFLSFKVACLKKMIMDKKHFGILNYGIYIYVQKLFLGVLIINFYRDVP